MKVGLSLSRCVRDIYLGRVDMADILVVISRTDFDPDLDSHWSSIWRGYTAPNREWAEIPAEHEEQIRDICCNLKNTGLLHQPRQHGGYPSRLPYHWMEAIPAEEEMTTHPAVLDAWQQFKTIAGLAGAKITHDQKDLL